MLVHVLLYGQIYYSEEVVQNPPSLHLLRERVRIVREGNHEKLFIIKSIKRELKTRPVYDCRCDERLKPKDDEST